MNHSTAMPVSRSAGVTQPTTGSTNLSARSATETTDNPPVIRSRNKRKADEISSEPKLLDRNACIQLEQKLRHLEKQVRLGQPICFKGRNLDRALEQHLTDATVALRVTHPNLGNVDADSLNRAIASFRQGIPDAYRSLVIDELVRSISPFESLASWEAARQLVSTVISHRRGDISDLRLALLSLRTSVNLPGIRACERNIGPLDDWFDRLLKLTLSLRANDAFRTSEEQELGRLLSELAATNTSPEPSPTPTKKAFTFDRRWIDTAAARRYDDLPSGLFVNQTNPPAARTAQAPDRTGHRDSQVPTDTAADSVPWASNSSSAMQFAPGINARSGAARLSLTSVGDKSSTSHVNRAADDRRVAHFADRSPDVDSVDGGSSSGWQLLFATEFGPGSDDSSADSSEDADATGTGPSTENRVLFVTEFGPDRDSSTADRSIKPEPEH